MTPAGYLYKKISARPDWLAKAKVLDICSLSGCVSENFTDYIDYWKHNGYWLFDSPEVIGEIAAEESIDLSEMTLFYYEVHEQKFDDRALAWKIFSPEAAFQTQVQPPVAKELAGFDVVSFSVRTSPECSPLSCNSLAEEIPVNEHCLFDTFREAREAIDSGLFKNSEPSPYRIFAVYRVQCAVQK